MKCLTRANEECATFGDEIVVQYRVFVWFSERGAGSLGGGTGKRPFAMINSMELSSVSNKCPL